MQILKYYINISCHLYRPSVVSWSWVAVSVSRKANRKWMRRNGTGTYKIFASRYFAPDFGKNGLVFSSHVATGRLRDKRIAGLNYQTSLMQLSCYVTVLRSLECHVILHSLLFQSTISSHWCQRNVNFFASKQATDPRVFNQPRTLGISAFLQTKL